MHEVAPSSDDDWHPANPRSASLPPIATPTGTRHTTNAGFVASNYRNNPPLVVQIMNQANPTFERALTAVRTELQAAATPLDVERLTDVIAGTYARLDTNRGQQTWTEAARRTRAAMRLLTAGRSVAAVETDVDQARHRALLGDAGLWPHPVQVMNLHQTKGGNDCGQDSAPRWSGDVVHVVGLEQVDTEVLGRQLRQRQERLGALDAGYLPHPLEQEQPEMVVVAHPRPRQHVHRAGDDSDLLYRRQSVQGTHDLALVGTLHGGHREVAGDVVQGQLVHVDAVAAEHPSRSNRAMR